MFATTYKQDMQMGVAEWNVRGINDGYKYMDILDNFIYLITLFRVV